MVIQQFCAHHPIEYSGLTDSEIKVDINQLIDLLWLANN